MTDDTTLDNENDSPSGLRAALEAAQREAAEARAQAEQLQRKDAFRDAGLDLSNPLHQTVAKAYDGELAPDAVKSYVDGLGLTATPPPAQAPESDDGAAHQRLAQASAGDGLPPQGSVDTERLAQLDQEMEAAYRRGDVAALDRLAREWDKLRPTPIQQ